MFLNDYIGEVRVIFLLSIIYFTEHITFIYIIRFKAYSHERDYVIYFTHLFMWYFVGLRMISLKWIKERGCSLPLNCNVNIDTQDVTSMTDMSSLTLKTVLQDLNGFDVFTDHCVKEFSVESPLFLFELSQLTYYMTQNDIISIDDIKFRIDINNHLIKNNTNGINDIISSFKHIYDQYLIDGATLEINVPNIIRGKTVKLIKAFISDINNNKKPDDTYKDDIIKIYESLKKCAKSVYKMLCSDTFGRFKQTNEFLNWFQNFSESVKSN